MVYSISFRSNLCSKTKYSHLLVCICTRKTKNIKLKAHHTWRYSSALLKSPGPSFATVTRLRDIQNHLSRMPDCVLRCRWGREWWVEGDEWKGEMELKASFRCPERNHQLGEDRKKTKQVSAIESDRANHESWLVSLWTSSTSVLPQFYYLVVLRSRHSYFNQDKMIPNVSRSCPELSLLPAHPFLSSFYNF